MKINGKLAITVRDVEFFRRRCYIGARIDCMVPNGNVDAKDYSERPGVCVILSKGRYTAQTSEGTMQWTLLTIWNIGLLLKWQDAERMKKRSQYEDCLYLEPQWGS